MPTGVLAYGTFTAFILLMLAIDLGVFSGKGKGQHVVSTKEAGTWVSVWVSLALLFNIGIWYFEGLDPALKFLTGYLVEYSLSVDNIFVFIMLFSYFQVPPEYRKRVLFWGILGALIMRALLIFVGATLIAKFHWVIYIFGAFLVFSGYKMFTAGDQDVDPGKNPVLVLFKKWFPVTNHYHREYFFVKEAGRWIATPMFIVLLTVETTDVIFALDSIPAIFGITNDPFIVFTSNVFAILGLRSLYFLLDGVMGMFHYLKYGLSLVLAFIGVKMLVSGLFHMPTWLSLLVVVGILAASVVLSILKPQEKEHEKEKSM